jgi:hypothetical protein
MAASGGSFGTKDVSPNIDSLHETIRLQIEATNKQSAVITRLTWAAVFLGIVQSIGTVIPLIQSCIK